ncbi:MAG: hypothetical protein ACRYE9_06210 [Janthinobacterium lividum]
MPSSKTILYFILILFSNGAATASEEKISLNKLNYCKVTPAAINDYEPREFQASNNLLRQSGEFSIYCGEKIIIKGRLLDQKCIPISDAKIYIWQAGCDGKYPYLPLRTHINKNLINILSKSSFKGSGIATTNNLGEFLFITIKPRRHSQNSPYVNIRVEHRNLGDLQTKLVLSSKHLINVEQSNQDSISLMENIDTYDFDVVMKGKSLSRY